MSPRSRLPVRHPVDVPSDPLAWRPMLAATLPRPQIVDDPVVEPLWSGRRVLAHVVQGAPLRLLDAAGTERAGEEADLAAAIAAAVAADDAVVDGILSIQPARGGVGAAILAQPRMSMKGLLLHRGADLEIERPASPDEAVLAFVAVDLLRVDGTTLLDLPLLERKRLLESVILPAERVRLSPVVQPPEDPWIASWQGGGLKGAILKGANSRYLPGEKTVEWRAVTRVAGRR